MLKLFVAVICVATLVVVALSVMLLKEVKITRDIAKREILVADLLDESSIVSEEIKAIKQRLEKRGGVCDGGTWGPLWYSTVREMCNTLIQAEKKRREIWGRMWAQVDTIHAIEQESITAPYRSSPIFLRILKEKYNQESEE